jgi:hypothetical protein
VAIVVLFATVAHAQSSAPDWSAEQQQQFEKWLQAEQKWREWMADHRNVVSHNWMGVGSRNWAGQSSDRKERPAPPAWLGPYCGDLTVDQLDDHVQCQQYERLKTYDWAAEAIRAEFQSAKTDKIERSHFNTKEHWGFGFGYDNRMVHGSFGMQLTVAEWGRWNYGTLGASVGFMRRPQANGQKQEREKSDVSLFLTLASASYRIKYVESLGMYWYVDFAQIYDVNHSMTGSQFGFSLSRK